MATSRKLSPRDFPPALREINDPPANLYLEGELPPLDSIFLTVVGSRRPSRYGQDVAKHLIESLAGYPIVIVSGLAIGLDTIAHQTALAVGLTTIAIPGSGLNRNVLHPPSNRRLADKIIAAGGALLSELEPETPAGVHTFPRRNRIMAGLAKAVLLIEAGEKSGTLITARLALDYNRDVLAVPGPIFSPTSFGTNQLISQGAMMITSSRDLLLALDFDEAEEGSQLTLELSSLEQKIIDQLAIEPQSRDELSRKLEISAPELNPLLTMLEIKGALKENLGELRLTSAIKNLQKNV